MYQADFVPSDGTYLLSHSVGRPLRTMQQHLRDHYFSVWEQAGTEVWPLWLDAIDDFRTALGRLFHVPKDGFCPQVNVSSGLTKVVMSLARLQQEQQLVLMSEIDFPSIGFVLQKALPRGYEQIRFIPKDCDVSNAAVWERHLATTSSSSEKIGLVFISHAYSNTGQQAPLNTIIKQARERDIWSVVDVAQAAGIIPLDLSENAPDFLLGSCIKWLCGGAGAGYLWVHPDRLDDCQPQDVGWFSHAQPFAFDIHDFRYHSGALKFWGGTPSVMPYVIAAHSVHYFAEIGSPALRQHNQRLIDQVTDEFGTEFVSPRDQARRSGTMVLHFGTRQQAIFTALQQANIQVDQRVTGVRVSPHIYSSSADIDHFLQTIKTNYRAVA